MSKAAVAAYEATVDDQREPGDGEGVRDPNRRWKRSMSPPIPQPLYVMPEACERAKDCPMDRKTVRRTEKEIEEAVAPSCLVKPCPSMP